MGICNKLGWTLTNAISYKIMNKVFSLIGLLVLTTTFGQEKWDLRTCVDHAVAHNLTVNQSKIQQEIIANDLENTRNQWLPNVGAYLDNSFTYGTHHPMINKSYQQYNNSLGVNSSITIYQGGLLNLNKERAALNVEASQFQTDQISDNIALQVVNYYLNVMLNRELLQIAQGNLTMSTEQVDRSKILFEGGRIAEAEWVQAEANRAQDVKNVADAKIEVDRALFNLSVLLQLEDYRNFDVEPIALPDDLTLGLYDLDQILAIAYAEQPAVKKAEIDLEMAAKDIRIAQTSLKPTISGSYNLGTSYADYFNKGLMTDAWLSQWHENLTQVVGVSVKIPIFEKFTNKLNIQRAKISESLAQNAMAQEKQKIKENVQEAYFNALSSYEAFQAAKESVRSNALSADFAQKSLDAGVINMYDLNIAQNNLMVAKAQMAQAKFNFIFRMKVLDFYAGIPLTEGL